MGRCSQVIFKSKKEQTIYHIPTLNVLDIGSTKIMCAQGYSSGRVTKLSGFGYHKALGMLDGNITDLKLCEDSILKAIDIAESQSGELVKNLNVALGGPAVQSKVIKISVAIKGDIIEDYHVELLFNELMRFADKQNKKVLHFLPQSYMLDGAMGVSDPRGMIAHELSGLFFVTLVQASFLDNFLNILERCHLKPKQFIASGYASAIGCLLKDEMELGVTHIDIGGRYTDIVCFQEGAIVQAFSISIGADHITQDIAKGIGVSMQEAERLKTLYGSSIIERGDNQRMLQVNSVDFATEKRVTQYLLTNIIRSRVEEIFEMITGQMRISLLSQGQRYVLTGGGSLLKDIKQKAELMLKSSVRLGTALNTQNFESTAMGPEFSVCSGLFKLAEANKQELITPNKKVSKRFLLDRIKSWIYDIT